MIKTVYSCVDFGVLVPKEKISKGDILRTVLLTDVLEQICILSKLEIPNLDDE